MRVHVLFAIALLGCSSKKESPQPTAASGSAPAPVTADAAVAVADAAAAGEPAPVTSADCLPKQDPDKEAIGFALTRVGGQLAICSGVASGIIGCWNVDARTGKLSARPTKPLPGTGFSIDPEKLPKPNCYEDMCWPAGGGEGPFPLVAYHPDGKRVAILTDSVQIFDVATKKLIKTVALHKGGDDAVEGEITNSATGLWFVGEMIYIRGSDAGPAAALFSYTLDGKAEKAMWGLYHGDVAVDDGKLYVNQDGLSSMTILDGASKKTVTRKVPKGPCKLEDNPEWTMEGDDDPKLKACMDYLAKHYLPYEGAQVVSDGASYLAFRAGRLLHLDAKLAETRHVDLAFCKSP